MDINQKVGELIRKYRNANHLSLEELAQKIHKSKSSMSKYEQGFVKIDLQTLDEIACALKLPLHAFLPETPSEQYAVPDGMLQLFAPSGERSDVAASQVELYLYFYGGALLEVRTALIELDRTNGETRMYVDPYEKKAASDVPFSTAETPSASTPSTGCISTTTMTGMTCFICNLPMPCREVPPYWGF